MPGGKTLLGDAHHRDHLIGVIDEDLLLASPVWIAKDRAMHEVEVSEVEQILHNQVLRRLVGEACQSPARRVDRWIEKRDVGDVRLVGRHRITPPDPGPAVARDHRVGIDAELRRDLRGRDERRGCARMPRSSRIANRDTDSGGCRR